MMRTVWTILVWMHCIGTTIRIVESAPTGGEWYHECKSGNCGYNHAAAYPSSSSSSSCRDDREQCVDYARRGECFANPGWMHVYCQRSCGLCDKIDDINDDDDVGNDCRDKHSNCPQWSEEMECVANPAFMSQACPASCNLCVNIRQLRTEGVPEEEIVRRKRLSETDFGLWQSIPKEDTNGAIRSRVKAMGEYMQQLAKLGRGTVCNNQHHECAKWAEDPEKNCESNIDFMISHCSLACQFCDVVEMYHTCRSSSPKKALTPFHDVTRVRDHLLHHKQAVNLVEGSCSAGSVAAKNSDSNADGWVVSMKWDESWNETLQTLNGWLTLETHEWVNATARHTDLSSFDWSGRILATPLPEPSLEIRDQFLSQVADVLSVPEPNVEAVFVRYTRGQRIGSHLDFRWHDSWKHSGVRVLSAYIVLQPPREGGSFGFPSLDWMLVEEPEMLVWPNIHSDEKSTGSKSNKVKRLERMESEQLPVIDGELYAAYVWVHEYPYDSNNVCS